MHLPDVKVADKCDLKKNKKFEFSEQSQISEARRFPYSGIKLTVTGKIFAKEQKNEQFVNVWVDVKALAH